MFYNYETNHSIFFAPDWIDSFNKLRELRAIARPSYRPSSEAAIVLFFEERAAKDAEQILVYCL